MGEDDLPTVLVLGGSTFVGKETVAALLSLPAQVHVVNRGRSYWGTNDVFGGRVKRWTADRNYRCSFSRCLSAATEDAGGRWALVADFSAFSGQDMHAALAGLSGCFDQYIFISSDSVYEVSERAASGWLPSGPISEADAKRPARLLARWQRWWHESYGCGKLEAEEVLAASLEKDATAARSISLRLPDVIGPFDDTLRLWAYWHWLRSGTPVEVDSMDDQPLALVFSRDVARFIADRVSRPALHDVAPRCDAVNLACTTQPTLVELLRQLAAASGQEPAFVESAGPTGFLPSVERPWPLCCDHARRVYNFQPTPLEEALTTSAHWFSQAHKQFPEMSRQAAKMLPFEETSTDSDGDSTDSESCGSLIA
eukprot:TRINITY_DN63819_c0_g1_i1.p1 TRINITY_DN63819_c0_g1~~TRINITY_DN63819_c0_g1_i1.p1  ORF type:complete len:369 (+),score=55.18 TRINITY_DN63819_c0_g1_i1:84-1190(+)